MGAVLAGAIWFVSSPATGAETLRFFSRFSEIEFHEADLNANGRIDPGEFETGQFVLRQNGDKAGHINFQCTRTSGPPARQVCFASVRVANKGTVQIQGGQTGSRESFNGAVAGGTGAYRGAQGIFHLKFTNNGIHVRIELD